MSEDPEKTMTWWRSQAERDGFARPEKKEFPDDIFEGMLRRREFLGLMAASAALAGLTACRKPTGRILPFDAEAEEMVPGKPLRFATTLTRGGYGRGAVVRSDEGRPTKVEGNPLHPDSLGACDSWMLASVLDLYDPDRSRTALDSGRTTAWPAAARALKAAVDATRQAHGAGLRVLTGAVTSPLLAAKMAALRRALPEARWHVHEPAGGSESEGARLAFGSPLRARCDFSAADVVVCLNADPLTGEPGSLAYARAFADRRDPDAGRRPVRLYAAEAAFSLTGANADHRLPAKPSRLPAVLAALSTALGLRVEGPALSGEETRWVKAAAEDLRAAGPRGLMIVGCREAPELQALGHALNARLGAAGRTVSYSEPVETSPSDAASSFAELCADLAAGRVAALLILDRNPAYSGPGAAGFLDALKRAPFTLHLGLHRDETAEACGWHVPLAHELESWGDARAFDGTASLRQPLIAPLYGGVGEAELLGAALGEDASDHDLLRSFWSGRGLDRAKWERALHDGVVAGTRLPARAAALASGWRPPRIRAPREGLELALRPSPAVWDGHRANNGWLQELPEPFSKLTWGEAAFLSPALAKRLGVGDGDELKLSAGGRALEAPAWIVPGQADETVVLSLGYGRRRAGRVAEGVGADAYAARARDDQWSVADLRVAATGARRKMPSTQGRQDMEGRELVREAGFDEYQRNPGFARPGEEPRETMLTPAPKASEEHAWGMSIDLSRCIGCSACVVACQAENNVAVVGAEEVARGRHMHWLRVDAYFKGEPSAPEGAAFQPVPCMHCEHAPCEEVCPVGATVHSDEGLNEMVYNRCVGTRYCSNNCPYKVRRFNFFRFASADPTLALANNPDVTVRERGVMEKCTYCVQRIQFARINAEEESRPIADGEITPACAAACPARAIVFGDLINKKSKVSQEKAKPRSYGLLSELGTRPRTTYLARVTNPKSGGPAS